MSAQIINRIKDIAQQFNVDTTANPNDDIWLNVWRAAKSGEWSIVESLIKEQVK